jgi:hypothetical protein
MAKIFNPPSELTLPKLDWENVKNYHKDCETYKQDLKKLLIEKYKRTGANVGEIIQFPVADGYAMYMVSSMKPLELIHLPFGDGWSFQYVHLLKAKDVQQKIDQAKALTKFFSERKKGE